MEVVLGQVEQLSALLVVSRSALVRDWDSLTLDRALEWARYFQHLYDRFRARPELREALGRRVGRAQALLKQGSGAEQAGDRDRDGTSLDGYQANAAEDGCTAGLLLSWLLGNQERFSAFCLCLPCSLLAFLAGHYSQLSRSYLDLLTAWGSHLLYDPLQGRWIKSCFDKAELSWEELRERFRCLCQGSTLLKEQTQAALKLLKTQDGDFKVCGLSVWSDLLMEVGC
ncbi:PREDICTED: Fanconi anemia group F protein [Corvus brachyrhynchos]|uniref:Fanconi anemia group F protein n=1 Tax=Corvus brachyrhynchos TaxID=85066 RepID=UPI000816430F|nr:PREDICTED: Fanconi anemia group F protein [Corvus brachyrhynchos]